jgi:Spy/CpxP family protein refolding chaperone
VTAEQLVWSVACFAAVSLVALVAWFLRRMTDEIGLRLSAIQDGLSGLSEKFGALVTDQRVHRVELSALIERAGHHEGKLEALVKENAEQREDIATLRAEVVALAGRLLQLEQRAADWSQTRQRREAS